jgi:hypothetical protein
MRFVGGLAGETGEDKVERQDLPVALGRARDESRDWIFAAGEPQNGVSRKDRSLKQVQTHALSGESIRRDQVTANRYAHLLLLQSATNIRIIDSPSHQQKVLRKPISGLAIACSILDAENSVRVVEKGLILIEKHSCVAGRAGS